MSRELYINGVYCRAGAGNYILMGLWPQCPWINVVATFAFGLQAGAKLEFLILLHRPTDDFFIGEMEKWRTALGFCGRKLASVDVTMSLKIQTCCDGDIVT